MSAGRPPKPTEMHVIQGTHRADRHGNASNAIAPSGHPVKPKYLGETAAAFWDSIVADLSNLGLVGSIDSACLAGMCEWYQRYRDCSKALEDLKPLSSEYYKLVITTQMCWKCFDAAAIQFGLTTAARTRLRVPEQKKKSGVERWRPKESAG